MFKFHGIEFRVQGDRVVNSLHQTVTPEYIKFRLGVQDFFTRKGIKSLDVLPCYIEKGECIRCIIAGDALCYGDPD